MLKKIINIIIVLIVVGAISAVFIKLYNDSKLETNNFKTTQEKGSINKKDKTENTEESIENNKNEDESKNDDSNEETEELNSNENNSETENSEASVEGSEIAVASTSSFQNIYFQIIGSIIIIAGISSIIIKIK